MALINTLRNKMGRFLVIVIGLSIASFVGADLLGPNSTILGNNSNEIGEIAGEDVTYEEFIAKQDEITFNFQQNNQGRSPSSSQQNYIRNQTWDALVSDYAFTKQFDKLGLAVTDSELEDMVTGDNINPQVRQAFTDPETGEFSKEQVVQFLQRWEEMPPNQQLAWINFEKSLAPGRRRTKFDNLLTMTNYATLEEAKYEYQNSSATANVRYLYIPYNSVKDTSIQVTDAELEAYLKDNAEEYKKDETKEIKYVAFDVQPSAEDTAFVKGEIEKLKLELAATDKDSTFALVNSDEEDAFSSHTMETLPDALKLEDGVVGQGVVVGPMVDDGSYVLYKISEISTADEYTARASHILFKWEDESNSAKAEAKKNARDVLRQIKNGADFAEMARVHGTDGTSSKGGDLGWFTEGKKMVKEFDDAVFARNNEGLLPDVVETQFGYHIIEVTSAKSNDSYKVARVALEIYISDETRNNVYREAETFALDADKLEKFEELAKEKDLEVTTANRVGKNDRRLSRLPEARSVVFWAYNEAKVGDVSDVFEIDDKYVIAALASAQEEGTADLNSVRNEIERKVKDAKIFDIISEKIKAMEQTELPDMAINYDGNGAKYYNMDNLKLSSNSLKSVGLAPEAVGVIFSMEAGERTEPFAINNGVILIELVEKLEAPEISDYETYRSQVAQKKQSKIARKVDNAVKELADIQDDRYKFF